MRMVVATAILLTGCGSPAPPAVEQPNEAQPAAPAAIPDADPARGSAAETSPPGRDDGSSGPGVSACRMQDGAEIPANRLKALGTEPFWAARIDGRCVTYLTPEDQKGTRIWTRFEPGPNGGVWNGALRGKRFQLYIQPHPDCSDGMSDKRYPLQARLLVEGEQRTGCAEPVTGS